MLLDGNWDFVGGGNTRRIVKGDATCLSIAAASILAKVTRDRIMRAEAEHFPGYDFELNKGYPCPRHKVALQGMGPDVDPPPQLGVHGPPAVVCHSRGSKPRRPYFATGGSLGSPSTRSPMMLRMTSSVPPATRMPGMPITSCYDANVPHSPESATNLGPRARLTKSATRNMFCVNESLPIDISGPGS